MQSQVDDDGIPVELFQILKDDSVKVLHSICHQDGTGYHDLNFLNIEF